MITGSYYRYTSSEPILLPLEEPLSSIGLQTDHEVPPIQQEVPLIQQELPPTQQEDTITVSVEDTLPSERSTTPPPPLSSPPPLSPVTRDDNAEEWREPQLNTSGYDHNSSCSSLDSSDAEDIFNEIDQADADHSNLSAIVAKGMNDSLGTLSNLSEENTVSINLYCYNFLPVVTMAGHVG